MVTFLITSLFILAFIAIAIYFWQKPSASGHGPAILPPPPPSGGLLFDEAFYQAGATLPSASDAATNKDHDGELFSRAQAGDKSVLQEARDTKLYERILGSLVSSADTDPKLLSLVSYVTRYELPVSRQLAERVIDSYKQAPDRHGTARTLHIAALANDAAVFQGAVEMVLKFWRAGQLSEVSPQELRSILDGEFWILSSSTRSSGDGFLLKQTLAGARRELEAAAKET